MDAALLKQLTMEKSSLKQHLLTTNNTDCKCNMKSQNLQMTLSVSLVLKTKA